VMFWCEQIVCGIYTILHPFEETMYDEVFTFTVMSTKGRRFVEPTTAATSPYN